MKEHNLIFTIEAWLSSAQTNTTPHPYLLPGYDAAFGNVGNGKGLAAYSEPLFRFEGQIIESTYQIIAYSFSFIHYSETTIDLNIIGVYRSSRNVNDQQLVSDLKRMINRDKICVISGDFNINYRTNSDHSVVTEILNMNFKQLIDTPTHRAGGIIDHLYIYRPSIFDDVIINYSLFSPFYSDHFGISLIINKGTNTFIKMPTTVHEHTFNNANEQRNERLPQNNSSSKRKRTPSESTKNKKRRPCSM